MDENIGSVQLASIEQEMRVSYLDYAMSVIVQRALPDARDGLKPVQRRILYAMSELGMRSNVRYRKSAGVVGEVLKNYHPHSDDAVYDTLVRMAQDFNLRYPLIDPQGNFGSVDGDGAAAMRYTECRLSSIADEMLADIDKNTVDFKPNYDASVEEPKVLPGASTKPAGQWRGGYRSWHGDQHPAAQSRRNLRCNHLSDRPAGLRHRRVDGDRPGSGFSDRRHNPRP